MRILSEETVGLVIDYQERLLPHMYEKERLIENSAILIEGLKALEIPIIVTEQYRKGLGSTVPEVRNILPLINPLEKTSFSCCDDGGINKAIVGNGLKFVVMCGIESHVCVLQTAIDLIEKNFVPVVVADCISSRKEHDKQIAVERMRQEGAIISSYESILFELCRIAGTAQFRTISKLVK
jgi:nicotinamidase-related amidase